MQHEQKLPSITEDASIAEHIPHLDRESNGRFKKGHSVNQFASKEYEKLRELRQRWWQCCTNERMKAVADELYKLALECPDPKIRLAASLNILDRTLGKPSTPIDLNIDSGQARQRPIDVNLTPEEQALLERIVAKQRDGFADAIPVPIANENKLALNPVE